MSRIVREISAFYEVGGQYGVPRARAEAVFGTATAIVSRYAGPIAIASTQGVRLNTDKNPLSPKSVRLGAARHSSLLTGRLAITDGEKVSPGATLITEGKIELGTKIVSKNVPVEADFSGGHTIALEAHEIGHSFGLDHCVGQLCLMNRAVSKKVLEAGKPFCDPHAEELELAGYRSLAARL